MIKPFDVATVILTNVFQLFEVLIP